ncbi:MAG: hypothetical protein QOI12_3253 [Alphaproteobacteria bacterium]|jgi:hypothetical protein|nr:hypothetical protein [Alphaproteobacteria bacterium]
MQDLRQNERLLRRLAPQGLDAPDAMATRITVL